MLVMDKAKTEPSKRRAFYLVVGVESHDDFEQGLQSNKTKAASPENPE